MKSIANLMIVVGIAATIGSVWLAHRNIRADLKEQIAALEPSAPASTKSIVQLRASLNRARTDVNKSLSNLRSIKTQAVMAGASVSRAKDSSIDSLNTLNDTLDEMNDVALKVEDEVRVLLAQYEDTLNAAVENSLESPPEKSGGGLDKWIAVIGALVSVAGIFLSFRSSSVSDEKTKLEIEKLKLELGSIADPPQTPTPNAE